MIDNRCGTRDKRNFFSQRAYCTAAEQVGRKRVQPKSSKSRVIRKESVYFWESYLS